LHPKLTHHVDPAREAALREFVRGHVALPTPGSFAWAVATGKTFRVNFEPSQLDSYAAQDLREFARDFNVRAVCVVPLVARGRTIGAMCALQAESGRRFSEADGALIVELAQRAALALDNVRLFGESREALREAEFANRAKDEFVAMVGHELRNPLAPIVTSLEVMARREGPANARERGIIERQVVHLSRMVDDLLDVSRVASGKIVLRRERVDLREVITRALELTEPVLRGRRRPPEVNGTDTPVWVDGDAVRLTQVLCNLITNAVKFSRGEQRIAIELGRDGDSAVLRVDDEGVGITPELAPHIFERFVQGEQALQRASGGLGLGWRSPRTWSSSMAARSPSKARASAGAPASPSPCRSSRRRGAGADCRDRAHVIGAADAHPGRRRQRRCGAVARHRAAPRGTRGGDGGRRRRGARPSSTVSRRRRRSSTSACRR
jgi:signal transduction histidine kinase